MPTTAHRSNRPPVPTARPSHARRRFLRALGVAGLVAVAFPGTAVGRHTGGCRVSYDVEDDDEEIRYCDGPGGGYYDVEEDDGDEVRYEWDEHGTIRRYEEEEDDGDEEVREYDAYGVLRYRRREDDDGDEREEWFDEHGTLRLLRWDDDDGDRGESRYDANGTLRYRFRRDDDGDRSEWYYDEHGVLIDSYHDD